MESSRGWTQGKKMGGTDEGLGQWMDGCGKNKGSGHKAYCEKDGP